MKINREEIEQVYTEHSYRLFRVSHRILGNSQEAEDVMQDTILKVCTDEDTAKIENLGAYLTRCCVNRSLDLLRKRHSHQTYQNELRYGMKDLSEEEGSKDLSGIVSKVTDLISRLPEKCRQILTLKLIEGYDYQEISQITSMKESSIRSIYMRGRQSLANLMKKEEMI